MKSKILKNQRGAALAEYTLILSLVAVGLVPALTNLQRSTGSILDRANLVISARSTTVEGGLVDTKTPTQAAPPSGTGSTEPGGTRVPEQPESR